MFYILNILFISLPIGRLPHSAKMYGEVFINGAKSHMPYGSYVSSSNILLPFNFIRGLFGRLSLETVAGLIALVFV